MSEEKEIIEEVKEETVEEVQVESKPKVYGDLPKYFIEDAVVKKENSDECYETTVYAKNKKLKAFEYFDKKQFDDVRNNMPIQVVGNVYLGKKYNEKKEPKEIKKNDYIGIANIQYDKDYKEKHNIEEEYIKFDVFKPKDKKCIGYASIGDNKYVRLCKKSPVVLIIVLVLVASVTLGTLVYMGTQHISFKDIFSTTQNDTYDGSDNGNSSEAYTDETEIPGYTKLLVNSKTPEVTLWNPEKNTVYFRYLIYLDDNKDNSPDDDTPIYETGLISPGYMVKADLKSVLEEGDHTLYIDLQCYDTTTQDRCNGAPQTGVSITVEK